MGEIKLELENLMSQTDDDLLEKLGRELWEKSAHAGPGTKGSLQQLAKEWVKSNLPAMKAAICGNPIVLKIRDKSDEVTLVTAIADIFLKTLSFPVPSVVAVLIVRIGLDRLCTSVQVSDES